MPATFDGRTAVSLAQIVLGNDSSANSKLAAIAAMAEIGGEEVVEPLANALTSDSDEQIQEACAQGLGKVGGATAAQALMRVAQTNHEVLVKAAQEALSQARAREGLPCLMENLDRMDADIRRGAADALGNIGDAAAVPALRKRLEWEGDPAVRQAISDALPALTGSQ